MIIIRFGGGLGNQLFQFAMLLTIKNNNPNSIVKYDASVYEYFNEHEGFDLPKYFIFNETPVERSVIKKFKPLFYYCKNFNIKSLNIYNRILFLEKLLLFFQKKIVKKSFCKVEEHGIYKYNSKVLSRFDNDEDYYFEGSWQNIRYYDIDFLRKNIKFNLTLLPKDKEWLQKIKCGNSIAIHVRRGDFVKLANTFLLCSQQYYITAIDLILKTKQLEETECNFFFFGDDHSYIYNNFCYSNMYVVEGSSPGVDMYLMSYAKYNVISNSTFSFWGALLNQHNKMTVMPRYFLKKNGVYLNFESPEGWYYIDNSKL